MILLIGFVGTPFQDDALARREPAPLRGIEAGDLLCRQSSQGEQRGETDFALADHGVVDDLIAARCRKTPRHAGFFPAFFRMNKALLVESLRTEVTRRYDRAVAALAGAHEAATGADTKAENKYDTRGLEASYLAAGQAEQAEELQRGLSALEAFEFRDFDFDDEIGTGALVEAEKDDELLYYLLAPAGGGLVLTADTGENITVLGPVAPLTMALKGKTAGIILSDPELIILEIS